MSNLRRDPDQIMNLQRAILQGRINCEDMCTVQLIDHSSSMNYECDYFTVINRFSQAPLFCYSKDFLLVIGCASLDISFFDTMCLICPYL